jgi:hypothetical protein
MCSYSRATSSPATVISHWLVSMVSLLHVPSDTLSGQISGLTKLIMAWCTDGCGLCLGRRCEGYENSHGSLFHAERDFKRFLTGGYCGVRRV